MRLLLQHRSRYQFDRPTLFGPHTVRLRPASHTRARVESYALHVTPADASVRWQQDPYGNHVARLSFRAGQREPALELNVELALDIRPVNPFDFFLDDRCAQLPFEYPSELRAELAPFLALDEPAFARGERFRQFFDTLPRSGPTVQTLVEINQRVQRAVRYVIREEAGIWTPEETLAHERGSCRDSGTLLIAALRSMGVAARFVSGYLIQLKDEGMLPDEPRGVSRDVVDLHAWAEVFLPGAGWIGFDATSGLLTGEGHVPLCCTSSPALAAPLDGTTEHGATSVDFELRIGRIGHEPRPTAPYTEETWATLLEAGRRADAGLSEAGLTLTTGGEPTFNSREHPEAPEWNGDAVGPTKWSQGLRLAQAIRERLMPGAALLIRMGKHYPGESLPRWALELVGRSDGEALWSGAVDVPPGDRASLDAKAAELARRLAQRLGISDGLQPAFEDPWRHLMDEASLPVEVDPLKADLSSSEERRRLARVLDRGLGNPVGWVLPLTRTGSAWSTERWSFRRGNLFLLQGDSPIGLRLPLGSLSAVSPPPPREQPVQPPDPRRKNVEEPRPAPHDARVRTALCFEAREGTLRVFLPPLPSAEDFIALLAAIDEERQALGVELLIEGYGPPSSALLRKLQVTPDPGVLEVNLPPSASSEEHVRLLESVFDAALHAGLHSEKYLLDGRTAGSGGGHHITLGGPTPLESPMVVRPALLASLVTFVQHHPSLSFLFTGLFVGPTSQAPRVDEARLDSLAELEIALSRMFEQKGETPPWLGDSLLRNLLVDVAGNTHRAELCIDKLFDWRTAHGRQGLLELRAFEMPPHPRMAAAQVLLVRSLVAALAKAPYRAPLVRWGAALHDRFLLPHFLWRDFEDVLGFLESRGVPLPIEGYRPFVELRCPEAGRLQLGDLVLTLRNALEPWPVLGEEPGLSGTSRYVDSSLERVELKVEGLVTERHRVLVNGQLLPLTPTPVANSYVAGVRFRAWAPAHSLQPHLGIHHPLRFDVLDTWGKRSIGACAYHVWHPEGRAFDQPPLTRFEASARRAQRFTLEGPLSWPVRPIGAAVLPEAPVTLDLRRAPGDHPMPQIEEEEA